MHPESTATLPQQQRPEELFDQLTQQEALCSTEATPQAEQQLPTMQAAEAHHGHGENCACCTATQPEATRKAEEAFDSLLGSSDGSRQEGSTGGVGEHPPNCSCGQHGADSKAEQVFSDVFGEESQASGHGHEPHKHAHGDTHEHGHDNHKHDVHEHTKHDHARENHDKQPRSHDGHEHHEHGKHVCSANCEHSSTAADKRGAEMLSEAEAQGHSHEHGENCACCTATQPEATKAAEDAFNDLLAENTSKTEAPQPATAEPGTTPRVQPEAPAHKHEAAHAASRHQAEQPDAAEHRVELAEPASGRETVQEKAHNSTAFDAGQARELLGAQEDSLGEGAPDVPQQLETAEADAGRDEEAPAHAVAEDGAALESFAEDPVTSAERAVDAAFGQEPVTDERFVETPDVGVALDEAVAVHIEQEAVAGGAVEAGEMLAAAENDAVDGSEAIVAAETGQTAADIAQETATPSAVIETFDQERDMPAAATAVAETIEELVPDATVEPAIAEALAAVVAVEGETAEHEPAEIRAALAEATNLSQQLVERGTQAATADVQQVIAQAERLSELLHIDSAELIKLLEIDPNNPQISVRTVEILSALQKLMHEAYRDEFAKRFARLRDSNDSQAAASIMQLLGNLVVTLTRRQREDYALAA